MCVSANHGGEHLLGGQWSQEHRARLHLVKRPTSQLGEVRETASHNENNHFHARLSQILLHQAPRLFLE